MTIALGPAARAQAPPPCAPGVAAAPVLGAAGYPEAAVVLGDQAGPLPATVSWTQSDGTAKGECSASASPTFTLLAAITPRLRRPRTTPGAVDESRMRLNLIRPGADLRLLEVRYRVLRARHFPGAQVKARIVDFPLRSSDRASTVPAP